MSNDLTELSDRLCVVAGMIMEDNNLLAVSTVADAVARSARLDELAIAAKDLTTLISAAEVLVRIG